MLNVESIRVKYASGLYSNTQLVLEYAQTLGAMQVLEILNYMVDKDVRPDLKKVCLEMPKVQEIYSIYHRSLRAEVQEIEDTNVSTRWKDEEFRRSSARLKYKLMEQLREYTWLTESILNSMYHD